jgi:hypothetical protein
MGQQYRHDELRPSYVPQHKAIVLLLWYLQYDILPSPANASNFFNSPGINFWYRKCMKWDSEGSQFFCEISTSKSLELQNNADNNREETLVYRILVQGAILDSAGKVIKDGPEDSDFLRASITSTFRVQPNDFTAVNFWEGITWRGILMCLRFTGKVRYNMFGETRTYEEAESEYGKMEAMEWAVEDYLGRAFFRQNLWERGW